MKRFVFFKWSSNWFNVAWKTLFKMNYKNNLKTVLSLQNKITFSPFFYYNIFTFTFLHVLLLIYLLTKGAQFPVAFLSRRMKERCWMFRWLNLEGFKAQTLKLNVWVKLTFVLSCILMKNLPFGAMFLNMN